MLFTSVTSHLHKAKLSLFSFYPIVATGIFELSVHYVIRTVSPGRPRVPWNPGSPYEYHK